MSTEIALILTGTLPEIAGNFDECKAFYNSELEKYKAVVTQETLPGAKADLTRLRAEVKRLDRIRIDEEARLKAPITAMAAKVKEITDMVSDTIAQIEKQVKVFEDETRNMCKFLMQAHLVTTYESLEVRKEFRTGDVTPLVGISKMTSKGALTKEARENVEGLAQHGRMAQDRMDGRIASIGAQCLAAGLESALPKEYFTAFLSESDAIWASNSAKIIKIEMDRLAISKRLREEAEKKKIADALETEKAQKKPAEPPKTTPPAVSTLKIPLYVSVTFRIDAKPDYDETKIRNYFLVQMKKTELPSPCDVAVLKEEK